MSSFLRRRRIALGRSGARARSDLAGRHMTARSPHARGLTRAIPELHRSQVRYRFVGDMAKFQG
ncbi:hypothetical protein ACFYWP_32620 [Actinacidiphila glaucinigra]|uniref:hypothetical protein n=1 Tax=Actinacidiphila glaucinigra TaxID=235986 RepID=UPI0036C3E5C6